MIPGTRQGSEPTLGRFAKKRDLQQESLPSTSTRKETISGLHNPCTIGVLLFHNLCNPCAIQQSSHDVCSQVATRFTGSASKLRSILPLDRSQPSNGKVRLSKIFAILMQSKNLHTFGEHNVPWNIEQGGCQLQRSETILDSALAERRREWSEHPTSGRKSNGNRDRETTRQS